MITKEYGLLWASSQNMVIRQQATDDRRSRVRINQKHKLFIFADAPENKPVPTGINVVDLGIDNKGQRIETKAIQEDLNSVSGTGKTLVFPAGIYKTGSLSISSNTKIYLSAGAILKAVDDISAFDFKDNVKPKSFIRIKDAQNVEISGRGIIDANGRLLRDKYADTARMRVLIENCFAYCSDDNVAVKTTGSSDYLQDVEDITVKGCVFITKKSSLLIHFQNLLKFWDSMKITGSRSLLKTCR